MIHTASARFWRCYDALPSDVQALADKNFKLLKGDPSHPSLQLKLIGNKLYSVRVGLHYRALGIPRSERHVLSKDRTLSTARRLPFAPSAIYRAFASPQRLASWWGPDGFTNTFEAFDFRVGGEWIFSAHARPGTG